MATPVHPDALPGAWTPAGQAGRRSQGGIYRLPVPLHVALVIVGVGVLFALFQAPFRHFEVLFASGLCNLLGFTGIKDPTGDYIFIQGSHQTPFFVEIAPTCSSLASILSLIGLATFISPRARRGVPNGRFVAAVAASCLVLFIGNTLRIVFSMLVGLADGEVSLVLFHDWVGSVFGFASLLAGWILLMWLILPDTTGGHGRHSMRHSVRGVFSSHSRATGEVGDGR